LGAIYASLDAVNHHKSIETILPADIELKWYEKDELFNWEEKLLKPMNNAGRREWSITLQNTKNVGLLFLGIEKGYYKEICYNINLSPLMIGLVLHHLKNPEEVLIIGSLLISHVNVFGNKNILSKVWEKMTNPQVIEFAKTHKLDYILSTVASIDPAITTNSPERTDALIYLYSRCGELLHDAQNYSESIKKICRLASRWMTDNEQLVFQWLAVNQPDMADLPIDWVITLWNLDEKH
jgi:hypothetical protein